MADVSEDSLQTPSDEPALDASSLALVPAEPAGQPVVFTPQKPEAGDQPNSFWSDKARDEMALRSMRPSSLPQPEDLPERMAGPTPARSQTADFGGSPQEWMRSLGNAFRGMAEENSKLRAELQSMKTVSGHESPYGRAFVGNPLAPAASMEAAAFGGNGIYGGPERSLGGSGLDWIRDLGKTFFSGGRSWSQDVAGQMMGQGLFARPPALGDQMGLGSGGHLGRPSELPGSGVCHGFGVPRSATECGDSAVRGCSGEPQPDPVGEPRREFESMFDVERLEARERERRGQSVGGPG